MNPAAVKRLEPGCLQVRDIVEAVVALNGMIPIPLHAALDETEAWTAALPRTPDVYGLVHNDLCEDNLLWLGGEPTVIDFDDCCFTWFAADIARTLGALHDGNPTRSSRACATA